MAAVATRRPSRVAIPTLRLRKSVGPLAIGQVLGVGGAELEARVDYIVSSGRSSMELVPVRWREAGKDEAVDLEMQK